MQLKAFRGNSEKDITLQGVYRSKIPVKVLKYIEKQEV